MIWILIISTVVIGILSYKIGFSDGYRNGELDNPTPCRHGHENWDDCPDCCH